MGWHAECIYYIRLATMPGQHGANKMTSSQILEKIQSLIADRRACVAVWLDSRNHSSLRNAAMDCRNELVSMTHRLEGAYCAAIRAERA